VTYDLSSLAPSDAEVALRSFPRRFRQVVRPIGDDDAVDALAAQPGSDGRSVLELLGALSARWALQRDALRQVLVADAPAVPTPAVDLSIPVPGPAAPTVEAALTRVAEGAEALADAVGAAPTSGWARTASTGAGATTTALDVVREAVRTGRDTLDVVERTLGELRRR
jgi:hypothetical protein